MQQKSLDTSAGLALKKMVKEYTLTSKRLQMILKRYQSVEYSVEQAAHSEGLSLREFYEFLKRKKIPTTYDLEELKRDLKTIKWNSE